MHSMQNMGGGLCTVVYVFERYKENIQTYRLEYSFYAFYANMGVLMVNIVQQEYTIRA